MVNQRIADRLRPTTSDSSRRVILAALAAGPLALRPWAHADDAAAKRKRKKCKNNNKSKKRKKKGQPEASCAESCHQTCTRCHHRPDGVPLCSSQGSVNCNFPCVTDSDCVGTGYPYCTTGQTHFASGTTQLWDCPSGFASFCADVEAC